MMKLFSKNRGSNSSIETHSRSPEPTQTEACKNESGSMQIIAPPSHPRAKSPNNGPEGKSIILSNVENFDPNKSAKNTNLFSINSIETLIKFIDYTPSEKIIDFERFVKDINKSARKKYVQYHPDKNRGDSKIFIALHDAIDKLMEKKLPTELAKFKSFYTNFNDKKSMQEYAKLRTKYFDTEAVEYFQSQQPWMLEDVANIVKNTYLKIEEKDYSIEEAMKESGLHNWEYATYDAYMNHRILPKIEEIYVNYGAGYMRASCGENIQTIIKNVGIRFSESIDTLEKTSIVNFGIRAMKNGLSEADYLKISGIKNPENISIIFDIAKHYRGKLESEIQNNRLLKDREQ